MSRARGPRRLPWSQFSSPPPPPVGRRSTGGRPPNPGSFLSRSTSTTDRGVKVAGMGDSVGISLLLLRCRLPLWSEVVSGWPGMVLVGAALDGDGGGRGLPDGLPFQGGGPPRVVAGGRAAASAPDEIDEEDKLRRAENKGGPGDAALHGEK